MRELLLLNPDNVSATEVGSYPVREAARAVVFDSQGNVALLFVANHNYYKLPGGGLEGKEDPVIGLRRECLEEIGCEIEIISELGIITEYRKMFSLKQISYCYVAKVVGAKGTPQFTEEEVESGFTQVWVTYEEAVAMVGTSSADNEEGKKYIVPRDHLILVEAGKRVGSVDQ